MNRHPIISALLFGIIGGAVGFLVGKKTTEIGTIEAFKQAAASGQPFTGFTKSPDDSSASAE